MTASELLVRWRLRIDAADPDAVRPRHLRAVAASLAEDPSTPHDASRKPYTILPLIDGPEWLELELTTLTRAAASHLERRVTALQRDGGGIDHFGPEADVRLAGSEPIAVLDQVTYADLVDDAVPARLHRLRFLSPVTFSNEPFPTARRVYGHLRSVWDTFAPTSLTFRLDLGDLIVHEYDIRSAVVTDGHRDRRGRYVDSEQVGSIGHVTYDASSYGTRERRHLATLSTFADFAGVGAATSIGMGVTRHELRDR